MERIKRIVFPGWSIVFYFMLNLLKINVKKYSRSSPDPENLWCDHQQPCNFFSVFVDSGNFQTTFRKTKIGRFEAEELTITEEKSFWLSQRERFLATIEKNLYWWASVYSTILVITELQFCCNAKPTCLDCVNSNIYSCILSLLKLQVTFWFMN